MFVVSKASQDTEYVGWLKGKNGLYKKQKSVLIKGGANVLNKKTMETVNGVITEVSKEDLDFLNTNSSFQRHLKAGWVSVHKALNDAKKKADEKELNEDGTVKKDGSAQLDEKDFEVRGMKPPVVNPDEMGL